jgi:hypothetical protein
LSASIDARKPGNGALLGVGSGVSFGNVTSTVFNTGAVLVQDASVATSAAVSGIAASASITATGASASAGASVIGADNGVGTVVDGSTTFGTIDQLARNTSTPPAAGNSPVTVRDSQISVTGVSGTAASVGIGATGASASVQASYIGSTGDGATIGARFGNITQGNPVNTTRVANTGVVSVSDVSIAAGAVDGIAASASISGTGAQSSVSVSAIENAGTLTGTSFGSIGQAVNNWYEAGGAGTFGGTVTVDGASITVSSLGGPAASASIAARGASASVGVNEIGSDVAMGSSSFGAITQSTLNLAPITVQNASITSTGGILGTAASASIAASGASAVFSVTSIANTQVMAPIQTASITQTADNRAAVINSGTIAVGGALGTAASASITATGASVGVSFTAIGGGSL